MREHLTGYARYVPVSRLSREAIGRATRTPAGRGTRAAAYFDEDALTLAVEAGRALGGVDGGPLLLASTSAPFADKANASLVHAALLVPDGIAAFDLGGLRGGFAALDLASRVGGTALVSDVRTGRPGSALERDGGDGAAAFRFGGDGTPIAEVVATSSRTLELMDTWRAGGGAARVWEERFSASVYEPALRDAGVEACKEAGIDRPTHTLVATADGRVAARVADAVGAEAGTDVLTTHRGTIGHCGAAELGLLLTDALDVASTGDTILLLSGAAGADAMLLRVLRDGPGVAAAGATLELDYADYLFWRGTVEREPARRPAPPDVSAPANHREVRWKYGLEGGACRTCGKVYLPAERVCGGCGAIDTIDPHPVADLTATVVAFSTDGISESLDPPGRAALVDFPGGGRLMVEVTEARDGVAIGDQVEMTFRRTFTTAGTPNYFWKARPTTEVAR